MTGMKSMHLGKLADIGRPIVGRIQTHRHGHTCKYHLWAARTKKFLKGHPGCWARLQGSYTPTVNCEQKTLAESHTPGQFDSYTHANTLQRVNTWKRLKGREERLRISP